MEQFIENIFLEDISSRFNDYFGMQLDIYTKTKDEFVENGKGHSAETIDELFSELEVISSK